MSRTSRVRGRDARQDKVDFRTLARLAFEIEPASQIIRDDGVDDVQAETGAAAIATCREERVEGFAPDIDAHAAAIVGKKDIHSVATGGLDLDIDVASFAVRKGVRDRIEEEVGRSCPYGPG